MRSPGSPSWAPDRRWYLATGGLCLLCWVVHGHVVLHAAFQYDDIHAIVENETIRSLANWGRWLTDPTAFSGLPFGGMYRPLVLASYSINFALGGLAPGGFSALNLCLHAANAALVLILLGRLGASLPAAAAGATLFAVHPVNVETVAYVSSRSESLAAFFVLAALLVHLRDGPASRSTGDDTATVSPYGPALYVGGLLCKSVAIVLLPLLLLTDLGLRRQPLNGRLLRRHAPYWAVTAVYVLGARHSVSQAVLENPVRSLATQLWTQAKALVYYADLLVVPRGLTVEHAFTEASAASAGTVLAATALLLSAAVSIAAVFRADRPLAFWLLWAGAVLSPTLLVPLNVLVNEHRLYLVTVALAGLVVALRPAFGWPARIRWPALLCVTALAVLAHERGGLWADAESLWGDAVRKAPMMPRGYLFLGDAYQRAGRHKEALRCYDTALSVNPGRLSPGDRLALHNNRGAALLSLHRYVAARAAYARALAILPDYPPARASMDALEAMQTTVQRDPQAESLARRGLAAMVAGDLGAAQTWLRRSLEMQSDDATRLALGLVHERQGSLLEAAQIYRGLARSAHSPGFAATAQQRLDSLSTVLPTGTGAGDP